jgi:hypothetical protein
VIAALVGSVVLTIAAAATVARLFTRKSKE